MVDHASKSTRHWQLITQQEVAWCRLTGQNRFTRRLSGSYKMTNGSHVRKLFFKNRRSHQRKRSSWVNGIHSQRNSQSRNPLRMANQWQCRRNSMRSSAMSDVFIVLFVSSPHFWFNCKSDPRSHYIHVLATPVISLAHSKFSSN